LIKVKSYAEKTKTANGWRDLKVENAAKLRFSSPEKFDRSVLHKTYYV